jgi:hypothetical protein
VIDRFNGATGAFLGTFIGSGDLISRANGMAFGNDGNLYVSQGFNANSEVRRYNGTSGALLGTFIAHDGRQPARSYWHRLHARARRRHIFGRLHLRGPDSTNVVARARSVGKGAGDMLSHDAGGASRDARYGRVVLHLLLRLPGERRHPRFEQWSWRLRTRVRRYSEIDGSFLGTSGVGDESLEDCHIGPDGKLYLSTNGLGQGWIKRYDWTTGASLGNLVNPGQNGYQMPQEFIFGADGNVYATSQSFNNGVTGVMKFNGTTGTTRGCSSPPAPAASERPLAS